MVPRKYLKIMVKFLLLWNLFSHVFARWTPMSNAVPMTRSSWFQRPRSQSRLDQEITLWLQSAKATLNEWYHRYLYSLPWRQHFGPRCCNKRCVAIAGGSEWSRNWVPKKYQYHIIIQGGNQLVTKSMAQLWPHFESWWLFEPPGGSPDVVHLIKYASQGS